MYQCSADPTGRILAVSWSGFVEPKELQDCLETVRGLAGTVKPGFVLFTDMTHVKNMDPECAPVLGQLMEQYTRMGLGANRGGKILFGTAGGYATLKRMTDRTDLLPPILRSAIEQEQKQVHNEDCQINLSELAMVEPTTVQPLVSIRFSRKTKDGNGKLDLSAALETLTPAERKVYPLLIQGLRTKEIADQLGCSFHTAKHHCAHIVEKCGVADRLALIAKAHPLPEPRKSNNPAFPTLPVVEAPPLPVARRKASEPV
jgi:DNA-binding CsgD family transcriptional regulator